MTSAMRLPSGITRRFTPEDAAAVLSAEIPVVVVRLNREVWGTIYRLLYADGYHVWVRAEAGTEEERMLEDASHAMGRTEREG